MVSARGGPNDHSIRKSTFALSFDEAISRAEKLWRRFRVTHRTGADLAGAGRVSGRIIRMHTEDLNYKGYVHHASKDDPQYEIKSDKTDHVALHKGRALRRLRR
ncbi:MAG: DUF2945 domain-containing protein [Pseudolabrys sp.]|nr:DUF2945 domain-containing protein [Pseudolabrys sp.]